MTTRARLLRSVATALGRRQLVWFGTRGDDVESITDLPNLEASVTITAPYRGRSKIRSTTVEEHAGYRVDLDAYEIDDDLANPAVQGARDALLRVLNRPSALVAYRPSQLASAVAFARADYCVELGMFKDHQVAFEHKPWVESRLREAGIDSIGWRYVADEEQLGLVASLSDGPLMLRPSRSSGGAGIVRVQDRDALLSAWPQRPEAFVSVAPYLDPVVPVNVGAVVWDSAITVHPASVQLIGVDGLTTRQFGYCGNDYAAFARLDEEIIDEIDSATRHIGEWLRRHGYRGAYGVDFLVHEGRAVFTEINPRFQGSTHLSAYISVMRGEPCILLEHLAAHLGLEPIVQRSLRDITADTPPVAHMVFHNCSSFRRAIDVRGCLDEVTQLPAHIRTDLVPTKSLELDPGAAVCRVTVRDQVTEDGFSLTGDWPARVAEIAALGRGSPELAQPSRR